MATTTGGSTYVTSTDLVANYPTASLALANRVDVVASGSMSKKTASYTVTVGDILAGTTICMNSASATVITLPSSSLVNGMRVNVFSVNTGAVTFTGGTVTGTVNSITSQYTGVSLTYDSAAAVWWCLPFSSGASAADFSNTATGSGSGYKYVRFTANGTLTVTRSGIAEVLICSGGSGYINAWSGGGDIDEQAGGGGDIVFGQFQLTAGSIAVTIGAGGSANNYPWVTAGSVSSLGSLASRVGRLYGMGYANLNAGVTSSITGSSLVYGVGGTLRPSSSTYGDGGASSGQGGTNGVVIVRVAV